MTRPLADLLDTAADVIADGNLVAALIGGCARNMYAPPRATKDVDLAMKLDADSFAVLVSALERRGFTRASMVKSDAEDTVPDLVIFRADDGGRIDVLIAKTLFEDAAIDRATLVGRLRVVSPEDLIAYKIISGRTRDIADIEDVVATQTRAGRPIDWSLIETSLQPWDVDERLATLRKRIEDDGR